jgi:hypothetical protein
MPSWADFLKMMEQEEPKDAKPAEPAKRSVAAKKTTAAPAAAPLDPEAEEKRKKRLEEDAKRKAELRAKITAGRSAAPKTDDAAPAADNLIDMSTPIETPIVKPEEPIVAAPASTVTVAEPEPAPVAAPVIAADTPRPDVPEPTIVATPEPVAATPEAPVEAASASSEEEPIPIPSKPLSGGAPGMSWADFMKSIENDPTPTDATAATSSPARPAGKRAPAAAVKKPADPEEEEKRKQRAAEAERKRIEMKEAIAKKKAEAAANKPAAAAAPATDDAVVRQPTPAVVAVPVEAVAAPVSEPVAVEVVTPAAAPAPAPEVVPEPTPVAQAPVESEQGVPATTQPVPVKVEEQPITPVAEPTPAPTPAATPAVAPADADNSFSDQQRRAEEALAKRQRAKEAEAERQRKEAEAQQAAAAAAAAVVTVAAQVSPAPSPAVVAAQAAPARTAEAVQREEYLRAREEQLHRQEEEMKRRVMELRQQEAMAASARPSAPAPASSSLRSSITFEQAHHSGSHSEFDFAGLGTTPRSSYREEDLDRIRSEIVSLFRGVLTKHEHALIGFIDGQNQAKYGSVHRDNEDLKRRVSQLEAQLKEVQDKYASLQTSSTSSMKELAVVRAKVHVSESRVATLENQLQLKVAENQKLTQLCDELISSLESTAGAPVH